MPTRTASPLGVGGMIVGQAGCQCLPLVGNRAPARQRLRMGADREGALTVIDHHTKTSSSMFDDFCGPAADISHTLYASPAIATSHAVV
jgi:xanthine dehydrogenase YagR molybdenum-binding subunit